MWTTGAGPGMTSQATRRELGIHGPMSGGGVAASITVSGGAALELGAGDADRAAFASSVRPAARMSASASSIASTASAEAGGDGAGIDGAGIASTGGILVAGSPTRRLPVRGCP